MMRLWLRKRFHQRGLGEKRCCGGCNLECALEKNKNARVESDSDSGAVSSDICSLGENPVDAVASECEVTRRKTLVENDDVKLLIHNFFSINPKSMCTPR